MNDQINLDTILATSGDIHGISLPLVLTVFLMIVIIGILSSRIARSHALSVKNLFMKINLNVKDHSQVGIIRVLDPKHAEIVTSFAPEKGSCIELVLSSLPNFPLKNIATMAIVQSVKPIGSQPSTHVVNVKFVPQSVEKVRDPLTNYLRDLHA